jgi:serine protease AprX
MAKDSERKRTGRQRARPTAGQTQPLGGGAQGPSEEPATAAGQAQPPGSAPQRSGEEPVVEQFPIPAKLVQHILLGPTNDRRVLQDSPILGDVWLAYAAEPGSIQDLLVTPARSATAATVAAEISTELGRFRRSGERAKEPARVAYLQGIVAARLYFDEVLKILVPMTRWWHQPNIQKKLTAYKPQEIEDRVCRLLAPERFRQTQSQASGARFDPECENFSALDRYIALAGLVLWSGEQRAPANDLKAIEIDQVFERYESHTDLIAKRILRLYGQIRTEGGQGAPPQVVQPAAADARLDEPGEEGDGLANIFQVSLNRPASTALNKSVPAVKADAAHTLFNVACDKIVWAVLDSGIDGTHPAFHTPDGRPRVRRTFDFTNIREIVSSDNGDITDERLEQLLTGVDLGATREQRMGEARRRLRLIAEDAQARRPVNWDVVEELITLTTPSRPPSAHGTHVAGIIGADPEGVNPQGARSGSGYSRGMCRDIRLYDFRVLAKTVEDTEFAVIAALQYIRNKNERHSYTTIHGANLSLSIPHSVRNFACGRTPVCNECERLVDSGVVVVAAAGNRGYQDFQTSDGTYEGYAAFSITDPGNGEGVITVGATHGNWPHTYGVSFFSSRGPTGDGRLKPDLVAPGERIQSTVLNHEWGAESGTSMAAPHVSGAAAMLLARYPELVGQPRRVKRILCESATDLGRDRTFQGHGMLDVLRAFQSI